MKLRQLVVLVTMLASSAAFAQKANTDKHTLSYAVGYEIGNDLVERKLDVDIDTVMRAVRDGYSKSKPAVAEQAMQRSLMAMQKKMRAEAMAEFKKVAASNKVKSAQFLKRNASRKGVVTLPSGVQYQVIENGKGDRHPGAGSTVTVHYRGALPNGLEFDSSFARGKPVTFKLNSVIKGWQEVLPRMSVGDHWKVYVPPELAYGEHGQPPRIGPNMALVFDIKLLGIK